MTRFQFMLSPPPRRAAPAVAYARCLVLAAMALILADRLEARSCATAETPCRVPLAPEAPVVDGQLDEAAWQDAVRVDDFVARLPVEGAPPSVRTEVWLLHTERSLYVALRAFDPEPAAIRAASMRRDDFAITGGDQFVVAIDSFRDRRNGYWFSTNPAGARVDAQFANEGERFETAWNGAWDAAARVDDQGWTAELEIPWATLRFHAAPEVEMGINLFRRVPRTAEQLFAPAIPLQHEYGTPNVSIARPYRFARIRGGTRLDLRPFALITARRATDRDASETADGGVFARFPVTDAVTVAAVARADFSEVEAEESQLNLTRFPLFLPERRDFFLQESGLFAFGAPEEAELYVSRTLGLASDREGAVQPVPIDWGVLGSGRAGPFELGWIAGATRALEGAPAERFDVARARVAVGGRSTLGGLWSRRESRGGLPRSTFGLDVSHFLAREVRLRGFAARDAEGGRRSDAWYLALGRGGERAAFELSALSLEPGFAPAVGLVARPGTRRFETRVTWPWFPGAERPVRRLAPTLRWVRYEEIGAPGFDDRIALALAAGWRDGRSLTGEVVRQRERLSQPFAIYRDVVVPAGEYRRWEAGLAFVGDATRPLAAEAEIRGGQLFGGRHAFGRLTVTWRPGVRWTWAGDLLGDRVELPASRFTAWVARARLGFTGSPRLRADLLLQFESEQRGAGFGLRARYDFAEGTQILLAWDTLEKETPVGFDRWQRRREERGALKVSYLHLF